MMTMSPATSAMILFLCFSWFPSLSLCFVPNTLFKTITLNQKSSSKISVRKQVPSFSTYETKQQQLLQASFFPPANQQEDQPYNKNKNSRNKWPLFAIRGLFAIRRASQVLIQMQHFLRRRLAPFFVAACLFFRGFPHPLYLPPPAYATVVARAAEAPPATSLRPGMTYEQARMVDRGEITQAQVAIQFSKSSSSIPFANPENTPAQEAKKSAMKNEEQEEDEDDYEDYDESSLQAESVFSSKSMLKTTDKKTDILRGVTRRSDFATIARHESEGVTKLKISLAVFIPVFGGTVLREYIRQKREANYVKKGLEIQRAQYAEYFNITETTDEANVDDALKGLKKNTNETNTTDVDENNNSDDDDDDDDDEKPSGGSRRRPPRRPRGDGGDGGSGSSSPSGAGSRAGNTNDPGYIRPSDQDLDRLKQLFNKS